MVTSILFIVMLSTFLGEPELRTATTHPMKYYVSLPTGWTKEKAWPIVVLIPDASRNFARNLSAFELARKNRPYILVAPHVVTSGGVNYRSANTYRYTADDWKKIKEVGDYRFDEEGIAAVMTDVKSLYHGEEQFYLTGWEAGGHTVWAMIFRHPEWLRAAAPVSSNYQGRWLDESAFSKLDARQKLPIEVLICDESAAHQGWKFIVAQTNNAIAIAQSHGFQNVKLKPVPSRPHGPLAEEVLDSFEMVRGSR